MAEREGFEPPELSLNGFQDRRLKPLGHLSGTLQRWTIDDRLLRMKDAVHLYLDRPPSPFVPRPS
jgi:hypothetical protein